MVITRCKKQEMISFLPAKQKSPPAQAMLLPQVFSLALSEA
jgi:hypothetical protein